MYIVHEIQSTSRHACKISRQVREKPLTLVSQESKANIFIHNKLKRTYILSARDHLNFDTFILWPTRCEIKTHPDENANEMLKLKPTDKNQCIIFHWKEYFLKCLKLCHEVKLYERKNCFLKSAIHCKKRLATHNSPLTWVSWTMIRLCVPRSIYNHVILSILHPSHLKFTISLIIHPFRNRETRWIHV